MKKYIIILLSILFIACINDGDRALKYAKDTNKNCYIVIIEKTKDYVVIDMYCGTAYPKRHKIRRVNK